MKIGQTVSLRSVIAWVESFRSSLELSVETDSAYRVILNNRNILGCDDASSMIVIGEWLRRS